MSFRGRGGRGRGRFGGGGGVRYAKQVPFELFPEIEGLGTAEFPQANLPLIKWSLILQKYYDSSPYRYEDRELSKKVQKPDIERYSDRNSQAKAKQTLEDFVKMGRDHMPAELSKGDKKEKRGVKRIRWNPESDWHKLDLFEQREHKAQGQEGNEDKENEEEDEQVGNEEDEGEFSDNGDYEQNEYSDDDELEFSFVMGEDVDDDEDDYNMAEDDNNEAIY